MGKQVLYQYLGSLEPKLRVIQVDFKKFMFSQGEKSRLLATLTSLQKKKFINIYLLSSEYNHLSVSQSLSQLLGLNQCLLGKS